MIPMLLFEEKKTSLTQHRQLQATVKQSPIQLTVLEEHNLTARCLDFQDWPIKWDYIIILTCLHAFDIGHIAGTPYTLLVNIPSSFSRNPCSNGNNFKKVFHMVVSSHGMPTSTSQAYLLLYVQPIFTLKHILSFVLINEYLILQWYYEFFSKRCHEMKT